MKSEKRKMKRGKLISAKRRRGGARGGKNFWDSPLEETSDEK